MCWTMTKDEEISLREDEVATIYRVGKVKGDVVSIEKECGTSRMYSKNLVYRSNTAIFMITAGHCLHDTLPASRSQPESRLRRCRSRSRNRRTDEPPSGGLGAVTSVSSRARACCMGCNASATTCRSRASISSIETPASRPSASAFFSALLDPLAERRPGLAGRGRHRLAGRFADAADRPAPGQTGSLPPSPACAHTLEAGPSFEQWSSCRGRRPGRRGRATRGGERSFIDQIFGSFSVVIYRGTA